MRSLRHALNGVARAGHIVGGAYRRSLVARYVSGSSALCVRCYHRSFLPGYVSQVSALVVRVWGAAGVVFDPPPPGSQLLPISDPSLVGERLCFTPNTDRLILLGLGVFVVGAVVFVSLEVLVVAGVINRYGQYCRILKFFFTVLQRLLVAFSKASSFYSNVEWLRMELARERPQLPPPVAEQQQLIPPVGEKQQILPHVAEQQQQQQLPPPVSEQQQHPPPSAEQQQLPPPVSKQQQHPPPLPPELDLC